MSGGPILSGYRAEVSAESDNCEADVEFLALRSARIIW